jgi:hypothetical protein
MGHKRRRHQLLECFFVETMMFGRSQVVNAAWQVFGSVTQQVQETVVGAEYISGQIGE